ncbi:MAG: hypothetical protein RIS35_2071 [Pseudomonadota bacterium]
MIAGEVLPGAEARPDPVSRESVIEVEDVVTRFGHQLVHQGVRFSVCRGELVALIGGSGTGKTVLMREMIGLRRPDAGTIRVLGTDMWSAPSTRLQAVRRRFGVVFQDGALFSSLTVAENVASPLREHTALPRRLIDPLVDLRLALAGLSPEVGRKMPGELSGGMRKRVALARALALEPELLFLDEPTSGLDPITARAFDALVRFLCRDLGITVLMVTHDLDTLAGIAERVIVLGQGRVLADGTPRQVRGVDDPWIREYFSGRTIPTVTDH